MRGFVPTPSSVVDLMVHKLFRERPPRPESEVLDPGCGPGAFIEGVIRWCAAHAAAVPRIVGVELDPRHVASARARFAGIPQVRIEHQDFLATHPGQYDYVVGNPPYVAITALSATEREAYRATYVTARGRFDLYLLFFEQALNALAPGGRLVFVTPEKFLYVGTAAPLRLLLAGRFVEELEFLSEDTFGELVTYPLVSSIAAEPSSRATRVTHRDGRTEEVRLMEGGGSWLPRIRGARGAPGLLTLGGICRRISCGVATGADAVFVVPDPQLDGALKPFARPTVAGRHLARGASLETRQVMLIPYVDDGRLIAEHELGVLGEYLSVPARRRRLLDRTCTVRKPWYAFHETPPLSDLLRPKLLCKDIGEEAFFVVDRHGDVVPRHSVYYIVPKDPEQLDDLAAYLNSDPALAWLRDHCQRAANGFIRLQSHVLKRLPVPDRFATEARDMPQVAMALETTPA